MAKRGLAIAPGLTLPLDAVTGTTAFVGNKGMGKTNGLIRFAEQVIRAGQQAVTLDPTDAHYGLKFGRDKGEEGLPVYVLGGFHGDADLEPTAGALIADVVVESRANFVLSLRKMSKTQMRSFVASFLERLYFLKGDEKNRNPTLVVMDEAHLFAPEGAGGDALTCLGAVQDVALLGRSSGLGIAFGTQRTAALSKSVLEVCEFLIAFRATGTNTRKALLNWVSAHDVDEQAEAFFGSIAGLDVGEAWAWSPGWLNIFERVKLYERETFDSSATPKAGQRLRPRGRAKVVDLAALGAQMVDTVERQHENDPKRLHVEIARLKSELETERSKPAAVAEPVVQTIEVIPAGWPEANANARASVISSLQRIRAMMDEADVTVYQALDTLSELVVEQAAKSSTEPVAPPRVSRGGSAASGETPSQKAEPMVLASTGVQPQSRHDAAATGSADDVRLTPMERSILSVLAQHQSRNRKQLALLSGYPWSGGFRNALSKLRREGLMLGGNQEQMKITGAGRAALGSTFEPGPPPGGRALFEWWATKISPMERAVLGYLVTVYPTVVPGPELAVCVDYPWSGGFRNALTTLRTLEFIVGKNTEGVAAADEFMQAIQ